MKVINVDTIGAGHEAIVKYLLLEGDEILTEDNELTWESPEPVCIHINRPIDEPMMSVACNFGPKQMGEYVKQFMTIHPKTETSATYYYSNRLFDYPTAIPPHFLLGNGDGHGINQIKDSIIDRLNGSPNSRRAVAITWVPSLDIASNEPPCLQLIQCFIRFGQLNMVVYIRSNDMLSAWGENAFALAYLMERIITGITMQDLRIGWLETISTSAHMYWKRDAEELKKFRRILGV